MVGYLLGAAVAIAGTALAVSAYRLRPGPAQRLGVIGFALYTLARLVATLGYLLMPGVASPDLYLVLNLVAALGLACVVYAYWKIASR